MEAPKKKLRNAVDPVIEPACARWSKEFILMRKDTDIIYVFLFLNLATRMSSKLRPQSHRSNTKFETALTWQMEGSSPTGSTLVDILSPLNTVRLWSVSKFPIFSISCVQPVSYRGRRKAISGERGYSINLS